ncbi:MAG: hypothetical protein JNL70_06060 [Saprospiraceae bacterium]|nr:hypothetical protein [Saprospiraceae bacterium]
MKTIKQLALMSAALFYCLMLHAATPNNTIAPNAVDPKLLAQSATTASSIADLILEAIMNFTPTNYPTKPVTLGTCPVVTLTPSGTSNPFPCSIKIDFGAGCTTRSGAYAEGSATATFTNRVSIPNAQVNCTFTNFKYNGILTSGAISFTMEGNDFVAYQNIKIVATDLYMRVGLQSVTYKTLEMRRKQVGGLETIPSYQGNFEWIKDDVYETEITKGECVFLGEKTSNVAVEATVVTTKNLTKAYTCQYPSSGILKLTGTEKDSYATVDFGNGTCDNTIIIKMGDNPRGLEVPLPARP